MSWLISQASKLCPEDISVSSITQALRNMALHTPLCSQQSPPPPTFPFLCIVNEELSLQGDLQPSLLRSGGDLLCRTSSVSISVLDLLIRTA